MTKDLFAALFMIIGSLFGFLSAIGVVRLPDVFTRMQATTKANTLGVGFIMLGLMLFFSELGATARALLIIAFIFITIPVGAHMLSRAAYFTKVPLWEGSVVDELEGKYDTEHHRLKGKDGSVKAQGDH